MRNILLLPLLLVALMCSVSASAFRLTCVAGTAGNTNESYENLTDGTSNKWCHGFSDSTFFVFKTNVPVFISGYTITTGNDNASYNHRNPKTWDLLASTDSLHWDTLDIVVNDNVLQDVNLTPFTYTLSSPTTVAYTYVMWVIHAHQGASSMQMSEFAIVGEADSSVPEPADPCLVTSFPWTEDFESFDDNTSVNGIKCYSTYSLQGEVKPWRTSSNVGGVTPHGGDRMLYAMYTSSSAGRTVSAVDLPVMLFEAGKHYEIHYYLKANGSTDSIGLRLGDTVIRTLKGTGGSGGWQELRDTIAGTGEAQHITFTFSNQDGLYAYLDDITISEVTVTEPEEPGEPGEPEEPENPCLVTTFPWTEDFESFADGASVNGIKCYSTYSLQGEVEPWRTSSNVASFTPHGGSRMLYAKYTSSDAGWTTSAVDLPAMLFERGKRYELHYFMSLNSRSDSLSVRLGETVLHALSGAGYNRWTEFRDTIVGTGVAQHITFTFGNNDGYYAFVDDITVSEVEGAEPEEPGEPGEPEEPENPCLVTTFPWTEDFESFADGASVNGIKCYSTYSLQGEVEPWRTSSRLAGTAPHGGDRMLYAMYTSSSAGRTVSAVDLPAMLFESGKRYELHYYMSLDSGDDSLSVRLGATVLRALTGAGYSRWTEFRDTIVGTGVAQHITFTFSNQDGFYAFVDDITVSEVEGAVVPTGWAELPERQDATKLIIGGRLFILLPDGTKYDALGRKVE